MRSKHLERLTLEQVTLARKLYFINHLPAANIAKMMNVDPPTIRNIINGITWKWLDPDYDLLAFCRLQERVSKAINFKPRKLIRID